MDKRDLYRLFRDAYLHWREDCAQLRAGALTFFIILPLPTLLLIVVEMFSLFLGEDQAIDILMQQIASVAGPAVAGLFHDLITSTNSPFGSVWTSIVVIAFSFGGAIGAFSVLRDAMDCIWDVHLPKGLPLVTRLRQKIVPFALLSAMGLIIIVWTIISSGLFTLIKIYSINGTWSDIGITIAQTLLSFVIATLLFAIIFKQIPEAKVHWRDVVLAAVITGVAFTIINAIFGTYISTFTVTTVAGAAGSLLIILLWIYVLNQIVLFGAEISHVYATSIGTHAKEYLPHVITRKETAIKNEEEKAPTGAPAPSERPVEGKMVPVKQENGSIEIDIKITPPNQKQQDGEEK
ncbi:MAG: YihY/virulence factor BrkB family protein [Candidatus Bathyarchaeota archaeon]|nr:YihY/virulence factor BrkB family protein [Candidatus Bathyarchaeota archaeon]